MPRTVHDAKIETRTARAKLRPSREPHWRSLGQGCAIGYYKGERDSSWIARCRPDGKDSGYFKEKLGRPDDLQDADGITVLNFAQAQELARKWFSEQTRRFNGLEVAEADYTVAHAINDYLEWFAVNRKSLRNTELSCRAFILPKLGKIKVSQLTARQIREWLEAIALSPARLRSGKSTTERKLRKAKTSDDQRKRKESANRVLTILKAALAMAYREGKVNSDDAWRRVKPFPNTDHPIIRFLNAEESTRLLNASPEEFRKLVKVALLTGARYGEIVAMQAADYSATLKQIYIRVGKTSKARHVPLNDEGVALFDAMTAGKTGSQPIFTRTDGKQWGTNHQSRLIKEACKNANISPAISFNDLRHTYASLIAQAGADIFTISKLLGHADTRITTRHYAHLCDRTLATAVARYLPQFEQEQPSVITPIRPKRDRV